MPASSSAARTVSFASANGGRSGKIRPKSTPLAGTPAPVIARCNAALNKVLADPAVVEKLAGLGYIPGPGEPGKFTEVLRQQIEELTMRAKAAGIEQQ